MTTRLRALAASHRVRLAADVALSLALLVGCLAEIAAAGESWNGWVPAEIALAVASTVPLVWRRSHPLVVFVVVFAAGVGSALIVLPVQGPFETFVAVVFAAYSVGVHAPNVSSVRAIVAVLAVGAATTIGVVLLSDANPGNWVPMLVWFLVAWLLGRVVRGRNLRTLELERLTLQLQEERDARAREAVTVERARIARELHDVVAHNISLMSVQAAAAHRVMRDDQPEVRDALSAIESTGRETVDEMRRMLGVLREPDDELVLSPQPSLRDLGDLAAQVRAAGLVAEVRVEGDEVALPTGLDLSIYRIVQEALTNAIKHAKPGTKVEVVLRYRNNTVEIEIVDDGAVAVAGGPAGGHGLVGMRERVALFGGDLKAGPRDGGGWAVHATLPVVTS